MRLDKKKKILALYEREIKDNTETVDGELLRDTLYPHQKKVWDYLINGGNRAVLVWHRRAGKDILALTWLFYAAMKRRGDYWYILQSFGAAKRFIWEGHMMGGKKYIDIIPEKYITQKYKNNLSIKLINGSMIYFMTSENFEKNIRGGNPVGIVFSEYSLMDSRLYGVLRPILAPKGHNGWIMFLFTPQGHNHAFDLYEGALNQTGWYRELLTIRDTRSSDGEPIISEEAVALDRRTGMREEEIQREYYCSFDMGTQGAYYSQQMALALTEGRITSCSYENPRSNQVSPIFTFWDLGINDPTIIWFMQIRGDGYYFFDYHADTGQEIGAYTKVLLRKREEHGYVYGMHILPHDGSRADSIRTRGTRQWILDNNAKQHNLGEFVITNSMNVRDGIALVQTSLKKCHFDAYTCSAGIDALRQYRQHRVGRYDTYADYPEHDWASHAADAMRYGIIFLNIAGQTGRVWGGFQTPIRDEYTDMDTYNVFDYHKNL